MAMRVSAGGGWEGSNWLKTAGRYTVGVKVSNGIWMFSMLPLLEVAWGKPPLAVGGSTASPHASTSLTRCVLLKTPIPSISSIAVIRGSQTGRLIRFLIQVLPLGS
jgi:hypothetical protein